MSTTYNPEIQIFYGPMDTNHRLVPAPDISISIEYNYSNDTVIGYTYVITLNGNLTATDLTKDNLAAGPGAIMDRLHSLRQILSQNGNNLHIIKSNPSDPEDLSNSILVAKGGILRSFNIEQSSNNLVNFVPYTASIEFSLLDLNDNTEDCDNLFIDPSGCDPCSNNLYDYKIKSFQDSWSFTFDENESYKRIKPTDTITANIDNNSFTLQYNISAVGKHFFVYENEQDEQGKLLPAWEQAKNFAQFRLYHQVTNLISKVLKDSYADACTSNDTLADILAPGSSGLLSGLSPYKVYNETISCDISESEGSFAATYNAIVKSSLGNSLYSSPDTKHTVNKSVTTTNSNGIPITNISVNGTIEGLIEGGLIYSDTAIQLPSKGSLFISKSNNLVHKYDSAKKLLDKIYTDSAFNYGGKRDLIQTYKTALDVTTTSLGITPPNNDPTPNPPHPVSFNLTHDYNQGTITYSVEYTNKKLCGQYINDISIQTTNPTKVMAIFNIPNGNYCPYVQELGTYTPKKVILSVKGIDSTNIGQPTDLSIVDEINSALNLDCLSIPYLPITLPPPGTYIITQQSYTKNPIDGSFSVDISYICNTLGCSP